MLKVTILILGGLAAISCIPVEPTTENNLFVFSTFDHGSPLPEHGEEVSAHNLPADVQNDDILKKKIVAIPLSKVTTDTKILSNDAGHALVAKIEERSNEDNDDMETAETIVFRPLFASRRKQAQRRRVYVPVGYQQYSRPYYQQYSSRPYYQNAQRRYYPVYYHKAQFPVIA